MRFISIALALSLSLIFGLSLKAQENEMFKNPGCMCCDKWAEHMIDNGFDIKITPSPDVAKLKRFWEFHLRLGDVIPVSSMGLLSKDMYLLTSFKNY